MKERLHTVAMKYHQELVQYAEDPFPGDAVQKFLDDRLISEEAVKKFVLGVVNPVRGHERYKGMVSIPYRDALGNVTALKFRSLDPDGPKYANLPGQRMSLFNIGDTADPRVYVTEGEFDAIILSQMGLSAVAIPGVTHWKPHWRWLFRDCEEVIVMLDRDDKGQGRDASKRVAENIGQVAPVREAILPRGHDVNSLFLEDQQKLEDLL